MRIAGIIAEYDPFHNGHAAHIASTRAENGGNATHVVAVISGSFTQRGEPALLSKFQRATMALANGADLVLELPLPWAMAPAESFAAGGVAVLNALRCVDLISFGSECGDTAAIKTLADITTDADYQTELKKALSAGIPYAAAGQAAIAAIIGNEAAEILSSPNNTLGIEYLRAAKNQGANWDVYTLQRNGAHHNDSTPTGRFASATMLRKAVRNHKVEAVTEYMPSSSYELLMEVYNSEEIATHTERLEQALMVHLRRSSATEYSNLPWLSEGIENRLYRESRMATDYNRLLSAIKTRRYPMARLKRILWASLIGLTKDDTIGLPPYIRVLGMNDRGKEILSAAKPTLPTVTRATQIDALDTRAQRIFALECTATDLHATTMGTPLPCGTDYTTKMIVK